jgi:thymidylate synthase
MRDVITTLITSGEATSPSRGSAGEIRGATIQLNNPRARLSRSETRGRVFSSLAELCWYLSGSDRVEPIKHYLSHYEEEAEPDGTVYAAYGPRLLSFDGLDQIRYVIDTLTRRPFSRRAVIQIFDHEDIKEPHRHVPCTCVLQYFLRSDALDAVTYMRSNDAYKGLPHDIFAFTMIQELIARSLNTDVGLYIHMVGSLHLYEPDAGKAQNFLDEGYTSHIEMPAMPIGDPWRSVSRLLDFEAALRTGADPLGVVLDDEPYWQDLGRLFAIFYLLRQKRYSDVELLRDQLSCADYNVFVADKMFNRGVTSDVRVDDDLRRPPR